MLISRRRHRGLRSARTALTGLFALRAGPLLFGQDSQTGAARLSGLLIGAELAIGLEAHGSEPLILRLRMGPRTDIWQHVLCWMLPAAGSMPKRRCVTGCSRSLRRSGQNASLRETTHDRT